MNNRDVGVILYLVGNILAESMPVNRQCPACRNLGGIGSFHNDGVKAAHFLFEHAHGIFQAGSPQGVAADQLGKFRRLMRRRIFNRTHFIKRNLCAHIGGLPGSFCAGKPRPNDDDFFHYFFLPFFVLVSFSASAAASASLAFLASARWRIFSSSLLMGWSIRVSQASLLQ